MREGDRERGGEEEVRHREREMNTTPLRNRGFVSKR